MTALEARYGDKKLVSVGTYLRKMQEMKRGKGVSLADFLEDYEEARSEAITHGWTPSPETDGLALLAASSLTTEQHAGILSRLQAIDIDQTPSYEAVTNQLELLASSMEMIEAVTKDLQQTALITPSSGKEKGKNSKGKWSKGKGKGDKGGKGKGWNNHWQNNQRNQSWGKNWNQQQGKNQWNHGKGGAKGKGKPPCWSFQTGQCWRGNDCRFSHEVVKTEQKGDQKGDGKTKGDGKGGGSGAAAPAHPY